MVCGEVRDGVVHNNDAKILLISFVSIALSANFVAVPGALLAPYLCDGLGRRRTFTASCIIFIMGVSFVVLAPSLVSNDDDAYPAMMVGRVLTVCVNSITIFYFMCNISDLINSGIWNWCGLGN